MPNKRVYFNSYGTEGEFSGSLVGILDSFTSASIPLDANNRHYQQYLFLSASDRAIAVDGTGSIPGDVTNSPEVYTVTPVTSSHP